MPARKRARRDADRPVGVAWRHSIVAFLLAVVCTTALVLLSAQSREQAERSRAMGVGADHAIALERYFERALSATYSMAALVRAGHGEIADFERIGGEMLSYHPGVSAVELAPGGVIDRIVPLAGNEQAVGHDLLRDPKRSKEAFLARDSGRLTLAGPFPLMQGGVGVAGRLPVYLGDPPNARFWGFSIVVLKFPSAVEGAGLPSLEERGFGYALWRTHPDSGQRQIIAASESWASVVDPIERPVQVGNTTWTLSIAPIDGWGDARRLALEAMLALLASLMVGWLTRLGLMLRAHRRNLESLVQQRTAQLAAREADLERAQAVAQIGSWTVDPEAEDRWCELSSEARRILGIPPERGSLTREEFIARIHAADRVAFLHAWDGALGGARTGIECRVESDGVLRWVRIKAQLAAQPDGSRRLVGTLQDITERKHADQALRVAAAAFETNDGIVITDAQRTIQQVNRAYCAMSGCEPDELVGRNARILQSGRHDGRFYDAVWQSIERTGAWAGEVWNRRKNGEMYPAWLTMTAVRTEDGQVTNYVSTVVDITLRKAAEDEIARLAFLDPLTHLPNRRMLMDRLQHALASRARSGGCGALLYLDLDHFKQLNDQHGHDLGDDLLRQVAVRLQSTVRECDTVARLGGDEFVVLLENLDSDPREAERQALTVARKILGKFREVFHLSTLQYQVTTSIGLTVFDERPTTVSALLKQADMAMYRAKAAARNTVRAFDPVWTREQQQVAEAIETRW